MKILPASTRRPFRRGPFQIHRVYPGLVLGEDWNDTGIAGLGCFDHAQLDQGLVVPMHEHRNDEIVSYLRSGQMVHEDSHGVRAELSPTHLMGMNAGSGFWHEESVPVGQVEMLQIFIRPEAAELAPDLQFCQLPEAASIGSWRLIAGPQTERAPLYVRQRVRVLDVQVPVGASILIPQEEGYEAALLYVFGGQASIVGQSLQAGDSIGWMAPPAHSILISSATKVTDLVMFQIDKQARFTRSGTLSG